MDWFVEAADEFAATDLRHRIAAYLRRHCTADSDIAGAEVVVSELLANALRHASTPFWVTLEWTGNQPVLSVFDLGPGFDMQPELPTSAESIGGRGLYIASQIGTDLQARRRTERGSTVEVTLPVRRPSTVHLDPPRHRHGRLPALEDAAPGGGFGRDAFLLAVTVQMAQTSEETQGPQAIEAVIAQVGTDVGAQMEIEYRAATGAHGALSAEQLAECYVRLKEAIGGGFHIVEVTPTRIVLGNTRCPFGDAVRRAPALCRMTSSVFGGIAASSTGRPATVDLQERIALGDPGCRVVIDLAPEAHSPGHHYQPPKNG